MIKRKQHFVHSPPHSIGDCHRTAIACLLDLEPHEVPHFAEGLYAGLTPEEDGKVFEQRMQEWLLGRGLVAFHFGIPGQFGIDGICQAFGGINQGIAFLLGGQSPRGTNHTVIADSTGVIWDPSYETKDGEPSIVGPMDDGNFWATLMLTAKHKP